MIEVIVFAAVGIFIGWHHRVINDKIDELFDALDERPVPPTVTTSNPEFVNRNQAGHTESLIIEPKSPQLVEFEEQQELDRLGKFTGKSQGKMK